MNYVNNGDYYLIAKYKNEDPYYIKLNQNWYLKEKKDDCFVSGNDISAIDLVTSKFENEEQMKERMYKYGYIKHKDTDIYIVHKNKYNGKEYINEYEIIYNNQQKEKRIELLNKMAYKRLYNDEINENLLDDFMNKYLTKCQHSIAFKEFMTCPFSTIDKYLKENIMKKQNLDYSIKYKLKDKITTYPFIRNIISMWNIYDELENKNKDLTGRQLSKKIREDYVEMLNSKNSRRLDHQQIIKYLDKNNIEGQISIDEYLSEEKSYDELMAELINEERALEKSPYDDKYIQSLVDKYGIVGVFPRITKEYMINLSLEDKFRLGLIGSYVEYKRLKRNNGKKRS